MDPVITGTTTVTVLCAALVTRRWGAWRWLAVLAGVPAVLVGIGQQGTAAPIALLLISLGLLVGCWRARPGLALAATALVLVLAAVVVSWAIPATGRLPGFRAWAGLAVALALALGGAAGLSRSRLSGLRIACAVTAGVPLVFVVSTSSTDAIAAWWPVAGALGLTALLRGARGTTASRPQVDDVDQAAIAEFDARYHLPRLAPVTVVIAAYDEAGGLPDVLGALPRATRDLALDVLVVDDGSTDETADAAERTGGAYVVRCPVNRGQGAALRLGYRVAREHGARYIVTTDADGQYDVADIPVVLAPILSDRADFVTGSRRRGHQPVQDPIRRLGVHVFGWLVTVLTGHHLTDTSFGLRAMRAEVSATVTLNQPQYQSSELLIGVLSHGFRVHEVPGTMHARGTGASKKGRNVVYGRRYAGVVLSTWWREGCPTPVDDCAAVRGSDHHDRAHAILEDGANQGA